MIHCSIICFGQKNLTPIVAQIDPNMFNESLWLKQETKYQDITGSPFLHEEWCMGKIILSEKEFLNLWLKYDTYSEDLLCKLKKDSIIKISNTDLKGFEMDIEGEKVIFSKQKVGDEDKLVRIVSEGKYLSIYQYTLSIVKEVNPQNGYEMSKPVKKRFRVKTQYYFKLDGKKNQKLPNSLNRFLKNNNMKRAGEVKSFFKKNKLNFKKLEDLKMLVLFYNKLYS